MNSSRFHTGANGARRPPSQAPAISVARRARRGAAVRKRARMAVLSHRPDGARPRLSVVSGKTDTSTGVTASKPHSATRRHVSSASARVTWRANGGATSTGTLTVHGKSAPARSATARRMTRSTCARRSAEPPNSSSRRL